MAPVYSVAVIQFEPKMFKPLALEENHATAESYIRAAAERGCCLAVLPEYHLTSWEPSNPGFRKACVESASYLPRYQELARQLDISIVPGTICEPLPTQDTDGSVELGNVAYFIAAGTGDICGRYQKKNLWHTERPHLTSSGHVPHSAFDTPLRHADGRSVRAGMLICWDLGFPEAFRALIADGADIIIIPSWWFPDDLSDDALGINPQSERVYLESATTLRAFENTAAIVFSNAGGLSSVTMPVQGCLGRLGLGEEKMLVADVDLKVLEVAEENYKVRQDIGSRGWHYGYTISKGST
ncbi:Nitrilase-like protein [Hapsidospora chrysogenum ATCC 11550]|uniref:Nitrilase-like protein n=1 Tax=Hapsidospora chrysogenum (strain ATCC 11550 / CBS 779.69 / DSM 880 / IAM 14645 / JCM 23072 / IMI 49137) TaxID=857340 RepID=A0A086T8J4_HAPC1|nr:Nitrilase-like protein [Hapsidospora chrysogenum ATCC 11550]